MKYNNEGNPATKLGENTQSVDLPTTKTRKSGSRLSPRKLSALTRRLIVEEFCASGDMDEVAKTYRIPVRTVDSILHWASLRKPPAVERRLEVVGRRQTA